jgi:two-component system, NarL family, sensor histidine kinase UhpB
LTLKLRLNLIITALLLVVMFAGAFLSLNNARQNAHAEVVSAEKLVLYLFDTAILSNPNLGQNKLGNNSFHLQQLKHMRHLKIELIDNQGKVVDSNQTPDENAFQNEAPVWFERLLNQLTSNWEPSVRKLEYQGATLGELVITPDPTYEYAEKWKQITELLTLVLVFFILVNLMVIWAVSQALKPTTKILDALNELENGNLAARLPAFKLPELSRIGEKFNLMVEKLQQSILQNHKLTQQLITLQEEERKNLARELHDEFGQCLTAINTDASVISKVADKKYPELKESALAISKLSRHLIDMVSGLLQKLRPGILDELGLVPALIDLVDIWKSRHKNIACTINISEIKEDLSEALSIAIYRLVQEALTNISRHAEASEVQIELFSLSLSGQDGLQVIVKDNGIGLQHKHNNSHHLSGLGLPGMRERVEGLGGELTLKSNNGTEIKAWIPNKSY